MNLPNKLTIARLIMAPLFFVIFHLPMWTGQTSLTGISIILVLVLYAFIEITDLMDGIIARKRNMVTDLGKVMDPFADTFSRLTYFVCLMTVSIMSDWAFMIILWRELGMLFVRMLMMRQQKAVPANIFGKIKAVLYAISAVFGIGLYAFSFFARSSETLSLIANILFALAALASVISFIIYLKRIVSGKVLNSITR